MNGELIEAMGTNVVKSDWPSSEKEGVFFSESKVEKKMW
jgi:hypothetical protein